MTHTPANPDPLGVIAREIHEHNRPRIQGCPAWEELDPSDPWEAGMIRLAYDRARDFEAMYGGYEDAPGLPEPLQEGSPNHSNQKSE